MKKIFFTSTVFAFLLLSNVYGQSQIELTFSAEYNGLHIALDSIFVENLMQGGDTTLYYPDTVLTLIFTGISSYDGTGKNTLSVSQNHPNPFEDQTYVNVFLPENEFIMISIFDVLGREVAHYENTLNSGNHSFIFYPGNEKYYLLSAKTRGEKRSINMLNTGSKNEADCKIVYKGSATKNLKPKSIKSNFVCTISDHLLYIGYATHGTITDSDVIEDTLTDSESFVFVYVNGIPCPGIPTVTDTEGNIYNTVQIGSQCWMAENLKVGTMINSTIGGQLQIDNGLIEKYCYDNNSSNCNIYGGLYEWNEMMQYNPSDAGNPGATQGICPYGWHIPTETEWKSLTDYLGGESVAGGKMKEAGTTHWNSPNTSATNESGFTALPSGNRYYFSGSFSFISSHGYFWSATEYDIDDAWKRSLSYDGAGVFLIKDDKTSGRSVRCLKD